MHAIFGALNLVETLEMYGASYMLGNELTEDALG